MRKLLAIGEALIDFISIDKGRLVKESEGFIPKVGGAPANVCGAYAKLGGVAEMITMLGEDAFGDKIIDYLKENNVRTNYIARTKEASTSLAFVSRSAKGERDFCFFRKPGADMLLEPSQVQKSWFEKSYALHFCSVSLGKFPMRDAHLEAIKYAKECQLLLSFDPNLRPQLWSNLEDLRATVLQFIPFSNILKISDDELSFLTGEDKIENALKDLFVGSVELILYTCGSKGAQAFTKKVHVSVPGMTGLNVVDTTGAGDAFIGSFLYQLSIDKIGICQLQDLTARQLKRYLRFSNMYCAKSIQAEGAIASYPPLDEMNKYMEEEEYEGI